MPESPDVGKRVGMDAEVRRLTQTDFATFGELVIHGDAVCKTLELPWKDNANGVSCIPAGTYWVEREFSPAFKRDLFELKDVPHRSECKFHPANVPHELKGCIALGEDYGTVGGEDGVVRSRAAVDTFMALYADADGFWLTVTDPRANPTASDAA